jgi:hypothetical protein
MTRDLSSLDRDIRFAIANKRLVELFYETKRRVAEPHDYGIQKGAVKLLVYQVGGESSSRIPGWKHLDLAKIERLVVLDETFPGSRGAAHRYHKSWDVLFARVK